MPDTIDTTQVKWDDAPAPARIDLSRVKWDAPPAPASSPEIDASKVHWDEGGVQIPKLPGGMPTVRPSAAPQPAPHVIAPAPNNAPLPTPAQLQNLGDPDALPHPNAGPGTPEAQANYEEQQRRNAAFKSEPVISLLNGANAGEMGVGQMAAGLAGLASHSALVPAPIRPAVQAISDDARRFYDERIRQAQQDANPTAFAVGQMAPTVAATVASGGVGAEVGGAAQLGAAGTRLAAGAAGAALPTGGYYGRSVGEQEAAGVPPGQAHARAANESDVVAPANALLYSLPLGQLVPGAGGAAQRMAAGAVEGGLINPAATGVEGAVAHLGHGAPMPSAGEYARSAAVGAAMGLGAGAVGALSEPRAGETRAPAATPEPIDVSKVKWDTTPAAAPEGQTRAVQEQGPAGILQREPQQAGEAGGERGRVQPGQQGQEAAGAGAAQEEAARPQQQEPQRQAPAGPGAGEPPAVAPPTPAAERIVDPAILVSGKVYTGQTHGDAINKALDAGDLTRDADGYLVDREGNDVARTGQIDLFTTSSGRLIDRFKASDRFGVTASENLDRATGRRRQEDATAVQEPPAQAAPVVSEQPAAVEPRNQPQPPPAPVEPPGRQELRRVLQDRADAGKQITTAQLKKFTGEPWADAILAQRTPRKPTSPDAISSRRAELQDQLRDLVVKEHGPDIADISSDHPLAMQVMRGEQSPGKLISLDTAVSEAQKLPDDHPARVVLHNLRELEKNPRGTKVQAVDTNDVPDGTRVVVNDGETFTIDKENGMVEDGVKGEIPEGGMKLYGKQVLPPQEHPDALLSRFREEAAAGDTQKLVGHRDYLNITGSEPTDKLRLQAINEEIAKRQPQSESKSSPQFYESQSPSAAEAGVFGQPVTPPAGIGAQGPLFHEPNAAAPVPRETVGSAEANKPENTVEMFPGGPKRGPATKQPWEMSAREWADQWDQTRANAQGTGGDRGIGGMGRATSEQGLAARVKAITDRRDFLKMGLPSRPDAMGEMSPPTHADVVAEAVRQGKPVPPEVLADYPELAQAESAPKIGDTVSALSRGGQPVSGVVKRIAGKLAQVDRGDGETILVKAESMKPFGQPGMKRATGTERGATTVADAERAIAPLRQRFPGVRMLVVNSPEDLPSVRNRERLGATTAGAVDASGTVYVFAGQTSDPVRTAWHEIVGHLGADATLTDAQRSAVMRSLREGGNASLFEHLDRHYPPEEHVGEAIAILSEQFAGRNRPTWYQRILDVVRYAWRRITGKTFDAGDVERLISKASRRAEGMDRADFRHTSKRAMRDLDADALRSTDTQGERTSDEATGRGGLEELTVGVAPRDAGRPRRGFAMIPDLQPAVGEVRRLRERFSAIEAKDSPALAQALINRVTVSDQAQSIVRAFERKSFAGAKDPEQAFKDFLTLGYHYRGELLRARGMPASNLPNLAPADVTRMMADPAVKKGVDTFNREIRPLLNDIRTAHGLPMDPNAGNVPFFLNLPSEQDASTGSQTNITFGKAFSKPATGEGEYAGDPQEALSRIIGGHLRTEAQAAIADQVKKLSIDPAKVVDPLGKRSPATFQQPRAGTPFVAPYKGSKVNVGVVDLNEGKTGAGGNPMPPDYHYVPERIAKEMNNLRQAPSPWDTPLDRINRGLTRLGLVGDFAPHSARVIAGVGQRLAQSGYNPASVLPSWLGSNVAAVRRMTQMAHSPIGETMQLLVDRSGSNRGHGYNIPEGAKSPLIKLLNLPHTALMDPEVGIDPLARRVVADAHLRMLLGNDRMTQVEKDVTSGKLTPIEASRQIEKSIKPDQFIALGRRVNATLGFSNRQTRSELLNWAQRIFPFVSSESGMIPDEVRRLVTANLNPVAVGRSVNRGQYGRAALQVASMLGSGAAGVYLLQNGLNYATTKLGRGEGRFMDQNDEGHKGDVEVAPGWYWTNLDPGLQRATRLTGLKDVQNKVAPHVGREAANEAMSTLSSGLRLAFSAMTGHEAHMGDDGKLLPSRSIWPVGIGRQTASAAQRGQDVGAGAVQDAAGLAGVQLRKSSGKNYSDAERLAHEISVRDVPARDQTPEERQQYEKKRTLIEALRQPAAQRTPLLLQAVKDGVIGRSDAREVLREAARSDFENEVQRMSASNAAKVYDAATPEEREKLRPLLWKKARDARKPEERQPLLDRLTKARPAA